MQHHKEQHITTSVTVKACCPTNIEVIVSVTGQPDVSLSNGEATTAYAYGDRVISVKEINRAVAPQAGQPPQDNDHVAPGAEQFPAI